MFRTCVERTNVPATGDTYEQKYLSFATTHVSFMVRPVLEMLYDALSNEVRKSI